jgi:hypothetical protein
MSDWRKWCDWCGWPLRGRKSKGCILGKCSMRPKPPLDTLGELRQEVRRLEAENKELKDLGF